MCGQKHKQTHIYKPQIPYQTQAGKGSHSWICLHDQAKAKREIIHYYLGSGQGHF